MRSKWSSGPSQLRRLWSWTTFWFAWQLSWLVFATWHDNWWGYIIAAVIIASMFWQAYNMGRRCMAEEVQAALNRAKQELREETAKLVLRGAPPMPAMMPMQALVVDMRDGEQNIVIHTDVCLN